MIVGIFHQGSGLGNQLFRYIAARVVAKDKGYDFGMVYNPDGSNKEGGFKGQSFMPLDWGKEPIGDFEQWNEKKIVDDKGNDIRGYDPDINFVQDNTVIEGEFQDPRYFEHRMKDIQKWLKTEPLDVPEDLCIIGFRGGEYAVFPDLFLKQSYWDEGVRMMKEINPDMKFQVHTDDVERAKQFFPDFECIHDIGMNWRSIRNARYSIIANSSFYIMPRLLQHFEDKKAVTIAPRWWARHNTRVWALPQNFYKQFKYI